MWHLEEVPSPQRWHYTRRQNPRRPLPSLLQFFLLSCNSFRVGVLAEYLILNKYLRNELLNESARGADCTPPTVARFFAPEGAPTRPLLRPGTLSSANCEAPCHLASGQLLPRRDPEGNWKAGSGAQQAGGGRRHSSCFAAIPVSMSAWPRHSLFPSSVRRLALVFNLILLSQNQPHLPLEGPATHAHTHKRTCHRCVVHPHTLEVWI